MSAKYRFQPTAISQLKEKYDLLVIGSGGMGLTAALQASELGLQVAILEKMPKLGGNTNRASSGMNAAETNVQLKHGIIDSYEDFYQDTFIGGGKMNDPRLLQYFTSHAALAIDWLAEHGIILDDITITGGMRIKRTHRPSSTAPIGGFLITNLLKQIEQKQLDVFVAVHADHLLQNGGKISGVSVSLADGTVKKISAPTVILATGGFGANPKLIKQIRPDLAHYQTTNQPGATGDGLKLAKEVGAAFVDLDQIQVHPTVQQDTDHPYLIGEAVRGEGAILVDQRAKRFVNELDTRKNVTAAINQLPEKNAYLILDSGIRQHVKAVDFYDYIGLVVHGADLAELAQKIKVPKKDLQQTVAVWNQQVAAQKDGDFGRSTGMDRPIAQAPYFAIHIAPAVHYTMGGVRINYQTQVLDKEDKPIKGLFAGGEVAGGLHGNNRIGGNSIAETVVFGRQAARQAYKYLKV
jgi:fumarate reductase flavoprotein subunit